MIVTSHSNFKKNKICPLLCTAWHGPHLKMRRFSPPRWTKARIRIIKKKPTIDIGHEYCRMSIYKATNRSKCCRQVQTQLYSDVTTP